MTIRPVAARKFRSFLRLPGTVQVGLPVTWLLLGVAKLLVLGFTFRCLAPWLGVPHGTSAFLPILNPAQRLRAQWIGLTVQTAARYAPWNANCFPQALVARWLLGWYGIPYALYFGMAREPDTQRLQAHAWVGAGPVRVTGGQAFGHFAVLAVFVSGDLVP